MSSESQQANSAMKKKHSFINIQSERQSLEHSIKYLSDTNVNELRDYSIIYLQFNKLPYLPKMKQ